MNLKDFYFDLPEKLIAQYPLANRGDSKLLSYNRKTCFYVHTYFKSIIDYLNPGDLLVMNDSKVVPARFFGQKQTGGKVEFLFERTIAPNIFLSHIKASKAPKVGCRIFLEKNFEIEVVSRDEIDESLFVCKANVEIEVLLSAVGHIPLPPYIQRSPEEIDKQRYQTIYAKHKGSVAAPTAGLHFDNEILQALQNKGVKLGYLTMHVGAGTFRPVRSQNVLEHKMHTEHYYLNEELSNIIKNVKAQKKRVIAVGTTAVRTLESCCVSGELKSGAGNTNLFIVPGFEFKICDGIITNFHLPESTLLMLVAAFIGYEKMHELYKVAISENYRFFSYGDASILL